MWLSVWFVCFWGAGVIWGSLGQYQVIFDLHFPLGKRCANDLPLFHSLDFSLYFFCCLGSGFSLLSVHLEHLLAMLKYGLRRLEYVFYIYVYLYSFTYRINVTGTIVQNSRVVEFCIMLECFKLSLRMLPNFVDPTKELDLLNVN